MATPQLIIKVISIFFCVIFLVSQIVAFVFGCIEEDFIFIIPTILGIAAGALGTWAVIREVKWAIILVMVLTLSALIWYAVLWATANAEQSKEDLLLLMEREHKCCGEDGPSYYTRQNKEIPATCYPKNKVGEKSALYQRGCVGVSKQLNLQNRGKHKPWKNTHLIILSTIIAFFVLLSFCVLLPCLIVLSPCCVLTCFSPCWCPCLACCLALGIITNDDIEAYKAPAGSQPPTKQLPNK